MNLRSLLTAVALALPVLLPAAGQADELPMTAEEFGLWRDYRSALDDPRVKKMPEKQRLPAIARNFRVSEKVLAKAVEKGEQHGETIGKQAEELTRAALADAELGRLKEVRVDTSASQVVVYVQWIAAAPEAVDREASLVAARVHKANPLARILKVEIYDPQLETRQLFEGLIDREKAGRIQEERIVDFASTRYARLFEKVKRAQP